MPITELHKRKLAKNLTVAGILLVMVSLLFAATLVKMGGG